MHCPRPLPTPSYRALVAAWRRWLGNQEWPWIAIIQTTGSTAFDLSSPVRLFVDGIAVSADKVTLRKSGTGSTLNLTTANIQALDDGQVVDILNGSRRWRMSLVGSTEAIRLTKRCTANLTTASNEGEPSPNAAAFNVKDDVATGYVNVRTGPGLKWPVIATIPAGTKGLKRTQPCRDRDDAPGYQFCPVTWNGVSGFVSMANLEVAEGDEPAALPVRKEPERVAAVAVTPPTPPSIERTSTGTGFVVSSQGHVLTNAHVATGCRSLSAALPGLSPQPARLVASDQTNDLALLLVPSMTSVTAPALSPGVRVGEAIAVFGFPYSGQLSKSGTFTKGDVSAVVGLRQNSSQLQITAPVQPGNSGGPVFDTYGNVVGVVVAKLNALGIAVATGDIPQSVNFAIKGSVAKSFLEANSVPLTTTVASQPMSNPDLADHAKAFTVFVTCGP